MHDSPLPYYGRKAFYGKLDVTSGFYSGSSFCSVRIRAGGGRNTHKTKKGCI